MNDAHARPRADAANRSPANSALGLVLALVFYLLLVGACAAVMILRPELRGEGLVGLVVALAFAPVGARVFSAKTAGLDDSMKRTLTSIQRTLETANHEAGLSESAKRVLHRKEDRELLRKAIEQDIAAQEWDAAMILVKELAERFGHRADAEEFRGRIERARAETLDRQVVGALQTLETMLAQHDWDEASSEAQRIERLFPDSPRVDGLRQRVETARSVHKNDLERRFLHAAQREEIDTAMDVLKELDSYLSEDEAEPLREVARGVIGKARDNLGVQFKLHVQDRNWRAAVTVGESIIAEFPNSRMAQEVREALDSIRERAATARQASVG